MRVKWIHTADVHLGNAQYGQRDRALDFARAFKYVCEYARDARADFMLIAGDLFHKRTVDPDTLLRAHVLLQELNDAGIPVYTVEGNHEQAGFGYVDSYLSYLSQLGMVHLLSPQPGADGLCAEPWDDDARAGTFADVRGVRVAGAGYYGNRTRAMLEQLLPSLEAHSPRPFTVLMLHTGLEGELPRQFGGITPSDLEMIRPHCEYLALGHVHKQYSAGSWVYNPGSLETCSAEEADWDRCFYEVTADTESRELVEVKAVPVPRRPFHRVSLEVVAHPTPDSLSHAVLAQVERRVQRDSRRPPILDVTLYGTLQFAESALDLKQLEERIRERFGPYLVRVRNSTVPAGFAGRYAADGEQLDRRALELQVMRDLVARDARFAESADEWAAAFQVIKDLALTGAPPERVLSLLEARQNPAPAGRGAS